MGGRLMPNGRWRIILGHGADRRYVYCDTWEEIEKEIRCERTEAKVRDVKRRWLNQEDDSDERDSAKQQEAPRLRDPCG